MNPYPASVAWCDVEVAAEPPPPRQRPQENFFFEGQQGFRTMPKNLLAAFQRGNEASEAEESESFFLQDYLQNLVLRVEGRLVQNDTRGGGPLTSAEIAELSLRAGRDDNPFEKVEPETLKIIAEWLYEHVLHAGSVSVLEKAGKVFSKDGDAPSQAMADLQQWIKTEGTVQVESLRRGIEAGSILLRMATARQVDARIVHEGILQATVTLFRSHLMQHIVPSWNQTGPKPTAVVEIVISPKKRRRSTPQSPIAANSTAAKEWKKLYKLVLSTLPAFLVLVEFLQSLLQSTNASLDDQHLLMMTNAATMSLEMDCQVANSYNSPTNTTSLGIHAALGPQVQIACIDLLTAAFQKNINDCRSTILEDFIGVLLKLPSGKRSLRAFEVRYTSALTPKALARQNAEWIRTLLTKTCPLDKNQPHRIQMMTALILQLLQSVVTRPVYQSEDGSEYRDGSQQTTLRSGLLKCRTVAIQIAGALLSRCSRKEASGAASEYRPILNNLVDDLLVTLLIPEYPSAEIMLGAIVERIQFDVEKATKNKAVTLEPTYLNLVFEVLGKIHAVQAQLLAKHRERPIEMKLSTSLQPQGMTFGCYCGTSREDSLIIQCDNCKTHFHGSCVGTNREVLMDEWICDACRLGRIANRERLKYGNNQDIPVIVDDLYAMRQSFLATLSHRTGVIGLEPAIAFHTARWADELEANHGTVAKAATRVVVHGIIECWDNGFANTKVGETLTEEGGIRVILALLAQTAPFFRLFLNHLAFLVSRLSDNVPASLRKLSVKAIERTVEGDHQLMSEQIVINAVSRRLNDESISVREAAVSLVGSYVVQFPKFTEAYHGSLLSCISDVGVSVRKRAVKIFVDILTSNPCYPGRASVFSVLIQRAADVREEDSLRDVIFQALAKLWMEDGGEVMDNTKPTQSSTLLLVESPPSQNAGVSSKLQTLRRADMAARQMTEVVQNGGTSAVLEEVLKKMLSSEDRLSGPRDSDRKKESKVIDEKQCDLLVRSLFEILLSTEEKGTNELAGKHIVAILQTISIFSDAVPASVYPHLSTVLPYLKGGNAKSIDDDALIVAAACDILFRVSSIFEREDLDRLSEESTAKDLQTIAYSFPPSALSAVVRFFACLAHHRHAAAETNVFSQKLLKTASMFYKCLLKHKGKTDFSTVSKSIRSNVRRALTVLGLVCQYHSHSHLEIRVEDDTNKDSILADCEELNWDNMIRECFKLFKLYFGKHDNPTKCSSLQALGAVFMVEPRLMIELEQEGFITTVLETADVSLQVEAMASWRKILIAEEKRVDDGYAKKQMEQDRKMTVSARISGDQDSDSNIFGGILTSYADSIFHQTRATNGRVRYAAVELLDVIMRQGLVNPNEAVPHLFALQGDLQNEKVRALACAMLSAEAERRPDTLRLRICAGVKEAFEFQTKLRGGEQASALLPNSHQKCHESIFDGVFLECLAKNKKQRQGLFKNLLNLFQLKDLALEESPEKKKTPKKSSYDVALLGFTAEILAYLPYTTTTDPLVIIHQIRTLVGLQGEQVIDVLAQVLRTVGLASEDEYDDRNAGEDDLEKSAASKFPSKTPEAALLSREEFDMPKFSRICQAASAMTLLLRLKRYLRQVYSLTEARCLDFNPNEKEKVGEKGVNKTDVKTPFDASVAKVDDMDSLIRHYAEFRKLMREENTIQTANEADSDLEDTDMPEPSVEDAETEESRKRKNSASS